MHPRPAVLSLLLLLPGTCVLPTTGNFAAWPVDRDGYEVEELPFVLTASYARGTEVYLGLDTGAILKVDDRDLSEQVALTSPLVGGPRLLFVSTAGVLFASADGQPLYRSTDGGGTWMVSLDVSVWRMDEDNQANLYAGNYTKDDEHVATLYKSADAGETWSVVFEDCDNHHIHTVRWDGRAGRLYIAFGDGPTRGQACSDNRGVSFLMLGCGPDQGHTDVAFTDDFVFWCSDDGSGQVLRVCRQSGQAEALLGPSQFIWFAVAREQQIYVGTVTSGRFGLERAALLASADQGNTWQKLLVTAPSTGPYTQGFFAESRQLSAGGWLYCTGGDASGPKSYRVRRAGSTLPLDSNHRLARTRTGWAGVAADDH